MAAQTNVKANYNTGQFITNANKLKLKLKLSDHIAPQMMNREKKSNLFKLKTNTVSFALSFKSVQRASINIVYDGGGGRRKASN